MEQDPESLVYDPRRGFLRKITSEEVSDGEYECYTDWNKLNDRVKVKAPPAPGGKD